MHRLTYTTRGGQSPSDVTRASWCGCSKKGACWLGTTSSYSIRAPARCRPPRCETLPVPALPGRIHRVSAMGRKRPLPPQPVCLSELSQSRSVGQPHGLDPGRVRRAVTCEGGTEPSPSDAVRIAPRGLLAAASGKRRSLGLPCPSDG